jgi:ABC-type nitrate/sulfonate/bicarbonate transport system permease component
MKAQLTPPVAVARDLGPARSRPSPAWWRVAWKRSRPAMLGLLSLVLVVLAWQLEAADKIVNVQWLPPPIDVLRASKSVVFSDRFLIDLKVSGEEFAIGLGISIVVGGLIGILCGWYKPVDEFLKPIIIAANSIPHLAVIPLLILVFGIGITPKVLVVLLSCVVVMEMNTAAGVENVDPHLMRLARSFGASDLKIIRTVVLPSVVPFFMTGVRISVGRAVVAVVVAELFGSYAGLGNLLTNAQSTLNMPVMYATLIILTILGIALTQLAGTFERRMQRWQA